MFKPNGNPGFPMEQGTVVLSLDVDLFWGHFDILDERRFTARFPNAAASYDHVLRSLCNARVSATWLVVGGVALSGTGGARDPRAAGLPREWSSRIPAGNEVTAPLWYRRSFVLQLANASVQQDIGLRGGLTHLIWTDPHSNREVVRKELEAGVAALAELGIRPAAFSFPRNLERHHDLLTEFGIRCYRGAERLGRSLPGSVVRLTSEMGRVTPKAVWPEQKHLGLWNIPASLSLYPIGETRSTIVPLQTRLDRFQKGVEEAARQRGVFHFSLNPVNLAESPRGYQLFDSLMERLAHARRSGDVSILTMAQLSGRMDALAERAGVQTAGAPPLSGQIVGAGQY